MPTKNIYSNRSPINDLIRRVNKIFNHNGSIQEISSPRHIITLMGTFHNEKIVSGTHTESSTPKAHLDLCEDEVEIEEQEIAEGSIVKFIGGSMYADCFVQFNADPNEDERCNFAHQINPDMKYKVLNISDEGIALMSQVNMSSIRRFKTHIDYLVPAED